MNIQLPIPSLDRWVACSGYPIPCYIFCPGCCTKKSKPQIDGELNKSTGSCISAHITFPRTISARGAERFACIWSWDRCCRWSSNRWGLGWSQAVLLWPRRLWRPMRFGGWRRSRGTDPYMPRRERWSDQKARGYYWWDRLSWFLHRRSDQLSCYAAGIEIKKNWRSPIYVAESNISIWVVFRAAESV